ncbi:MAG: hypothetical protein Q7S00_06375, partial [bacterium]|nr:hypothetical protein [bacterium]
KLGEATALGGQHPSLDRVEEELDRLESTLKDAGRWNNATERRISKLREDIDPLNSARREFFRARAQMKDVDAAKKLYRFRGLERHLPPQASGK